MATSGPAPFQWNKPSAAYPEYFAGDLPPGEPCPSSGGTRRGCWRMDTSMAPTTAVITNATLSDNEARLRLALDVAELGTWSFSLVDGSGHLDERAAQIVGLPAGDFPDVAAAQAAGTHPDDLARMQAAVA